MFFIKFINFKCTTTTAKNTNVAQSSMSQVTSIIRHDASSWLEEFGAKGNYREMRIKIQRQIKHVKYSSRWNTSHKTTNICDWMGLLEQQKENTTVYRNKDIKPISSTTDNDSKETENKNDTNAKNSNVAKDNDNNDKEKEKKKEKKSERKNSDETKKDENMSSNEKENGSRQNKYVMNIDCIDIGINLLNKGYNPLILNMADANDLGGVWQCGAGAQEENLFRRTFAQSLANNECYN